ncbi:retrovirus-related pol polyprotein from transposon TNT 1-94, partial [Tanacetum coccineum]
MILLRWWHIRGSSSRTTIPYYVTHPSLVVDYDDDYQGDVVQNNSEDPLTSAMILLARAITQRLSNPTNNRLCTSSNTINQAIVQGDRVNIQSKTFGNDGRNIRRSYVQEEIIEGNNVQNDAGNIQRTLRTTSSRTTTNVQCYNCSEKGHYARKYPKLRNDFLFADASQMEEIEELSANICLMARIQPANIDSDVGPSYDSAFLSEADRKAKRFEQESQSQLIHDRDVIRDLEQQRDKLDLSAVEFKRQIVELQKTQTILKRRMSENEDKYHDTNPKLYDASCLDDSKIQMNVRDIEDILDDATKSQIEMKRKSQDPIAIEKKQNVWTIDYKNSPYSSSETKPTVTPMPSENPMLVDLNKVETVFKTMFELLQTNSKRESIFYTSPEEIRLTNFCQQEVKPILHELHLNFEIFQKLFLRDIKEMKDVFDSTKNNFSETSKQNKLLKEQLLEAKLKHEIECCVLLSHECVDNSMQDEIEKIQRDSIEIQEGMQKRINILENDVQICQKQSLDFELQLQHEKERRKYESSLKNVCETSWISKMEKLETTSSVRRPSNRGSSFKNSVLSNTKNSSEKVEVSNRSNKTLDVASKNVDLNKKIVTNDDIKNILIAKNILCVSCTKNVLISCHDNCLVKYKLNMHSKVRRALFTNLRTVKSTFADTTHVVSKIRFSVKTVQSKSLDTTPVVSKTKIAAVTPLSAKNKDTISSMSDNFVVGMKRLHDVHEVIAAKVRVTAAKQNLVLL